MCNHQLLSLFNSSGLWEDCRGCFIFLKFESQASNTQRGGDCIKKPYILHLNPPRAFFSQMVTINANNATLTENEQSLVCFVFVLFGCWGLSWNQRIVQVGKGLKAHRVQRLCPVGPWQEVALRGNAATAGWLCACSPYQCGSQVSLVLLPRSRFPACCPSPDVCGRVCRCGSPEQRQQTVRSSSWTSLGCLAGPFMWKESTNKNLS